MKNRYILLLFLLFLGISDAMAQRVQEVETSGVVYDKSTGETLPGVNHHLPRSGGSLPRHH